MYIYAVFRIRMQIAFEDVGSFLIDLSRITISQIAYHFILNVEAECRELPL